MSIYPELPYIIYRHIIPKSETKAIQEESKQKTLNICFVIGIR